MKLNDCARVAAQQSLGGHGPRAYEHVSVTTVKENGRNVYASLPPRRAHGGPCRGDTRNGSPGGLTAERSLFTSYSSAAATRAASPHIKPFTRSVALTADGAVLTTRATITWCCSAELLLDVHAHDQSLRKKKTSLKYESTKCTCTSRDRANGGVCLGARILKRS